MFDLDASENGGVLSFKEAPDFENPADTDGDNVYHVTVRATDGTMYEERMVAVTVTDVNEAPMILGVGIAVSGPNSLTYAEGGRDAVGTYTASGPEAASAIWDASGDDAGHFMVDGSGESVMLMFRTSPDYEPPADADGDNLYEVTLEASDGTYTDSRDVMVTVTDADDAGSVTGLPASAMVGDVLTAMLDDEDSVVANTEWQWASSTTMGGSYADIDGASSASYTVADGDAGMYLRATASYNDAHGSQSAIGTVMVQAADPVLAEHDANKNGRIDLPEAVDALRRFLANDPDVPLSEAVAVLRLFLGNS